MAESIANTIFFPLSGDPIGFNHFGAAEWLLRTVPDVERVTFLLSNGHHPDPTKTDSRAGQGHRRRVCELAAAAVAHPEDSLLARRAKAAGTALTLSPERISISTAEFEFDRPVRSAEMITLLKEGGRDGAERLHWFAGSDLIARMCDPEIFSDEDLYILSRSCRYHVLERDGIPVHPALDQLRLRRSTVLSLEVHPLNGLPQWLWPFMSLSSTLIRAAAEAGDPITGMLPQPAAGYILGEGLYRQAPAVERRVDPQGVVLGGVSALQREVTRLEGALAWESETLAAELTALGAAGAPHTLGLVETTTGGEMTAALARRGGASRFFRQSRFAYDERAKTGLLGGALPGDSAVSEAVVREMAEAMRREAGTDYALAESGMAGPPDGSRRSMKYGLCWFACAGPRGTMAESMHLNPFLTRRQHQLAFACNGLGMVRRYLSGQDF
ncbi:MAG: CinA family protein [SAR324 cluster bacterium]|nr:CinA family protein [SAR324 cluster bacterium]